MNEYWADRMAANQDKLTAKNIKEIEKQLKKYYVTTMHSVIAEFEAVYDKLLAAVKDGRQITPADLYKLDKYWEMQSQLKQELQKLGDKEIELLSKAFEAEYFDIYNAIAIPGKQAFTTVSTAAAQQMINQVWVADGLNFSQRVWKNTNLLVETLNENLINCAVTGKTTSDLKKVLQDRFSVSYSRADSIVRTEMAHIQTQAAKKRYEDYGISEVMVWADKDERQCEECGKLHQKRYPSQGKMPVPAHPNCRCVIIPIVED